MIAWLRSLVWHLWAILTLVPYGTVAVVLSIFMRGPRLYWFCSGWMWLAVQGLRVICGVRWHETGRENLPEGPAIIVPKHQSAWETLALTFLCTHPLSFVFKRELLYIPFFGWSMARLDMIHIDRSQRARAWAKVLRQGRKFLAEGNWIIMFPEGTRTPRGSQGSYKAGAARLAADTGAPLIPVAVASARCWPKNSFVKYPGVVEISYGAPILPEGRTPESLTSQVEHWIETEMRRLDPEAYPAHGRKSAGPSASGDPTEGPEEQRA